MDKAIARMVLSSYRPQDGEDPIFAEALREADRDPELRDWFTESQRFDEVMREKFTAVPVARSVESAILGGAPTLAPTSRMRRRVWQVGGVAAALAAGLLLWRLILPVPRPGHELAAQAIAFSDRMPALQFVCFDAQEVAKWVNAQPGAQAVKLVLPPPSPSLGMGMIGSSIVQWNGRPVVMICLQNGRQMAMLYILQGAEGEGLAEGASETFTEAGWVVRAKKHRGQVQLLTARGGTENLNFPEIF